MINNSFPLCCCLFKKVCLARIVSVALCRIAECITAGIAAFGSHRGSSAASSTRLNVWLARLGYRDESSVETQLNVN